jgi:steroid 5-alpha reductase family enzyme
VFEAGAYFLGLAAAAGLLTLVWVVSLIRKDASIVDPVWSLAFIALGGTYRLASDTDYGVRPAVVLGLLLIWGIRLSAYLFWRNAGKGEDYRYQAMRERQGPHFPIKSLFTVFWLQAILAWIVSLPLLAAVNGTDPLGVFDYLGMAFWAIGIFFETTGDFQLARFKANPANQGKVMDSGVWRLTRHPNYFGDFMVWWGFYLFALGAGGWWSVVGPLLMSVLLMRVSGAALLEKKLGKTREGYKEYTRTTNGFFPGPKKKRA